MDRMVSQRPLLEIKDQSALTRTNALNLAAFANVTSGALGQAVLFDKGISGQAVSVGSAAVVVVQRTRFIMWIRPTGTQSAGTLFTKDFPSPLFVNVGRFVDGACKFSTIWMVGGFRSSPQNDVAASYINIRPEVLPIGPVVH